MLQALSIPAFPDNILNRGRDLAGYLVRRGFRIGSDHGGVWELDIRYQLHLETENSPNGDSGQHGYYSKSHQPVAQSQLSQMPH